MNNNNNTWINSMCAYNDWRRWQGVDKNFHNTKTISNLRWHPNIYIKCVCVCVACECVCMCALQMHISRYVSPVIPYLFWSFYFSVLLSSPGALYITKRDWKLFGRLPEIVFLRDSYARNICYQALRALEAILERFT